MNQVFRRPLDVQERLKTLGLTEELLQEAVARGFFAWLTCTANHPPAFPGILAWAESNSALRERLLPNGWERHNDRNLPLTVNRDSQIALTCSSGDEFTGVEDSVPRTRNPKGATTKEAVDMNCFQLGLFSEMPVPPREKDLEAVSEWATWLLLTYRDKDARVVRCELSRPTNIGLDGRVDGWAERIILRSLPFDGDVTDLRGKNDKGGDGSGSAEISGYTDAIQVDVRRRA